MPASYRQWSPDDDDDANKLTLQLNRSGGKNNNNGGYYYYKQKEGKSQSVLHRHGNCKKKRTIETFAGGRFR